MDRHANPRRRVVEKRIHVAEWVPWRQVRRAMIWLLGALLVYATGSVMWNDGFHTLGIILLAIAGVVAVVVLAALARAMWAARQEHRRSDVVETQTGGPLD